MCGRFSEPLRTAKIKSQTGRECRHDYGSVRAVSCQRRADGLQKSLQQLGFFGSAVDHAEVECTRIAFNKGQIGYAWQAQVLGGLNAECQPQTAGNKRDSGIRFVSAFFIVPPLEVNFELPRAGSA